MADVLVHNRLLGGGRRISRREFFQFVGVAVAGSVLAATGIEQAGGVSMAAVAVPALARSTFAPYIGDMFRVRDEASGTLALQLFKVRDLRAARSLAAQGRTVDPEHSFSILFRGPVDRPLGQDIYRFEHGRIGDFELFIAPMRAEPDGRYYEAIFNRLAA